MTKWNNRFRPPKDEWWSKGIDFTCLPECGRCCDEPGGIVYLSRQDAERIAEHQEMSLVSWLEKFCRTTYDGRFVLESKPSDGRCIYLTSEKVCTIYEVKPAQCSAFPFWGENLVTDRAWQKTKTICPGIDHPDAIMIDGDMIKLKLEADKAAEKGFRMV
ncbi:MAG: YkgJ family cysteine cluster protein [Euryarchaeota archaeon]|jgi:hypothetical protein|nr:YkgJ family cysteine cluster protein [Euryarchaeota archaeon]